uniref:Secreted protein n=1 Tax=Spermophilus dauricus TaxID=99837 RepID=A0A8C9PVB5_SPEDA
MLQSRVGCYVCILLMPEACGTHLHGVFLESNTQYYPSVTRSAQYLVLDLRTSQLKSQHAPCLQLLNSTVNLKIVPIYKGHVNILYMRCPHMCFIYGREWPH